MIDPEDPGTIDLVEITASERFEADFAAIFGRMPNAAPIGDQETHSLTDEINAFTSQEVRP